jgi:hypothetical protein
LNLTNPTYHPDHMKRERSILESHDVFGGGSVISLPAQFVLYLDVLGETKLLRKWYQTHLRRFGIKWRWKGKRFFAFKRVSNK